MPGHVLRVGLVLALLISALLVISAGAHSISHPAFERTWARTDLPVLNGHVHRTWMWGPEAHTEAFMEQYVDAPGGERLVQYTHKSRMEDNAFRASPPWDVTNGLLARELITGEVQTGDSSFEYYIPAEIHVAGDPHQSTPTYATFGSVLDGQPVPTGWTIIQTLDRPGHVGANDDLSRYGVTAEYHVDLTNHTVASVFWEFMNSSGQVYQNGQYVHDTLFENPFFAVGFPISEAFWVHIPVAGEWQDVLVQCFERRCLTYTPRNPEGWRVEAGNIGQAYYQWRYGDADPSVENGDDAQPDPQVNPVPTATPSPTSTPTPAPGPASQAECLDSFESQFLSLINQYRQSNGLQPLANSEALNVASFNHSKDMGERGYFAHDTPEGVSPFDRMDNVGYTYPTARAENIAAGYHSAQQVFEAWRNSPGHNQNMLHPDLRVIGIGRADVPGSEYGVYWTTKFGGHVDSAPSC